MRNEMIEAGKKWKEEIIKLGWKPTSMGWYPVEEIKKAGMTWSEKTKQYELSDVNKYLDWKKNYRPKKQNIILSTNPIENLLLKIKEKENE